MERKLRSLSAKRRIAVVPLSLAIVGGATFAFATFAPGANPTGHGLQGSRKSTDPPGRSQGKLGQDLFLAIDHRDLAAVKALLKQGADPNSTNGLSFQPLFIAAASHQDDVMQVLLDGGAKPDVATTYGSALTFACGSGNTTGAKLLLDRGAKIDVLRSDGMTPLMEAANTGVPDLVAELLKRKADITVKDDGGATALSLAARGGHVEILNMLIDAGGKVNDANVEGVTPLMEAAMNGHANCVAVLLKYRAPINARDNAGRTALKLTASYGDYPEVIKALRAAGARSDGIDGTIAATRGFSQTAMLLGAHHVSVESNQSPRVAVGRSLRLLQSSMKQFTESTNCVSCHQEGLGRITTGEAAARGFHLDPAVQRGQGQRLEGMLAALRPLHEAALKSAEVMKQVPLIEINEVTSGDSWLLAGMAAHREPATPARAAMAMVVARQQSKDGSWSFSVPRVPMQSSFFTFTALSVRSLAAYGPKSSAGEVHERIARAKNWLMHAPVQSSEDRASRLLGLKWAGADASVRQGSTKAIVADQRKDGGWSQLPNLPSDAYATGQALYALHVGGGMPVSDPIYQRGVRYLLRTQDPDGSWFVTKRAIPANNYFDAGFPHGESQYASFNGTSWATLALLETIDSRNR